MASCRAASGNNMEEEEIDRGEKRLNELGYKQELSRTMGKGKAIGIAFSTVTLFTGIIPLYGFSLSFGGPPPLVWGWLLVSLFTWFVALALAEICSSFPVIGGMLLVLYLPFVAPRNQTASFVFLKFQEFPNLATVPSKAYGVILSFLISQYSLFGYDAAAHLTEETKEADINGPIAILYSLGMVSILGWAVILALTFSIQDPHYLYDPNNETAGKFVPAQILYDAFYGRYHSGLGAVLMLINIWGSFFFGGLSTMTSAARIVYALARDGGLPYSAKWRMLHPKRKVPANAVWLCTLISILMALPILKLKVLFTAMSSICTIGWVGSHAVALLARARVPAKDFKHGRFHLGKAGRGVCWVALAWVCYTCAVFLLPTEYPFEWATFNYAPLAVFLVMSFSLLWWALDARHWFKGPLPNITS